MDPHTALARHGFCVLPAHFPPALIERCRAAFWPVLLRYLETHRDTPNRGPHRHFLPMPFHPPAFAPEFFFDPAILHILRTALGATPNGSRIVADQWGCDVPLLGSTFQQPHIDFARPLFPEAPDLALPPYILCVSFGLGPITLADGPIEIAPGTHRLPRAATAPPFEPIPLALGDVLIRHPWALHRGTPNTTPIPRALVTVRYVRHWYADASRDVNPIPPAVWQSLSPDQQALLRFPHE